MGNIISCRCETCLTTKEQVVTDKQTQKIISISQKSPIRNIIISPTTNIKIINKSYNSEKKDLSMSLEDSFKRNTNDNNINHLLDKLISEQFYEKLIQGERLHNLLEFLYAYDNNVLFNLMLLVLLKIKNILNDSMIIEYSTKVVHQNFIQIYISLIEDDVLEDIRKNIEEDSRIKYNLIDVLESCSEIYHFFKYQISERKKPYDTFYWDIFKNYQNYIEQKIQGIKKGIININLSLGDNKLKVIE